MILSKKSPNEFGLKAGIKKKRKAKMDFSAQRRSMKKMVETIFWNMQMPILFF